MNEDQLLPHSRLSEGAVPRSTSSRQTGRHKEHDVSGLDRLKELDSCWSKSFCEEGNWKISGKKTSEKRLLFSSGALSRHATKWLRPHEHTEVNQSEKVAVKRKSNGISAS